MTKITAESFERFHNEKPWEAMICFAEIGEEIAEVNNMFEIDSIEDDDANHPETEGVYFEAGQQFYVIFSISRNYAMGKDYKHFAIIPTTAAIAGQIVSSFIASKEKTINAMKAHMNKIKSFIEFKE